MEHHVLLPTLGIITCLQAQWIAQGKTLVILVSKGTKNTYICMQTFQFDILAMHTTANSVTHFILFVKLQLVVSSCAQDLSYVLAFSNFIRASTRLVGVVSQKVVRMAVLSARATKSLAKCISCSRSLTSMRELISGCGPTIAHAVPAVLYS